jgi:hypothetical protein
MIDAQIDQRWKKKLMRVDRENCHQLYDLAITTTRSHEELKRTWEALAQEEEIVIALRQRRQQ